MGSSVKKSATLLCTDTFGLPTQSRGRKNLSHNCDNENRQCADNQCSLSGIDNI